MLTLALGLATGWTLHSIVVAWRTRPARVRVNEAGHWEFPTDTMAQMLAIPVERRERFLVELPGILRGIWKLKDSYPLATLPGCVWVDDGLGELRPHVVNAPANSGDAFASRPIASGIEARQGGDAKQGSTRSAKARPDAQNQDGASHD